VNEARLLQMLCARYAGVRVLCTSAMVNELDTNCVCQWIDLVNLPSSTKIEGLVAVRDLKTNTGPTDEWMYELEAATNPYKPTSTLFDLLIQGKASDAKEQLEKLNTAEMERSEANHVVAIKNLQVHCTSHDALQATSKLLRTWN